MGKFANVDVDSMDITMEDSFATRMTHGTTVHLEVLPYPLMKIEELHRKANDIQ